MNLISQLAIIERASVVCRVYARLWGETDSTVVCAIVISAADKLYKNLLLEYHEDVYDVKLFLLT